MAQVTVNVLASDFKDNYYCNLSDDMDGCPLQRAFIRAGLVKEGESYKSLPRSVFHWDHPAETKVVAMFEGLIPVEDFSFTVEV